MIFKDKKYILHTETDNHINQWHFSNLKIISLLLIAIIVFGSFLLIGADYISTVLYEKRLREFKANYNSVASNIEDIHIRLKELDNQLIEIDTKPFSVMNYFTEDALINNYTNN